MIIISGMSKYKIIGCIILPSALMSFVGPMSAKRLLKARVIAALAFDFESYLAVSLVLDLARIARIDPWPLLLQWPPASRPETPL